MNSQKNLTTNGEADQAAKKAASCGRKTCCIKDHAYCAACNIFILISYRDNDIGINVATGM